MKRAILALFLFLVTVFPVHAQGSDQLQGGLNSSQQSAGEAVCGSVKEKQAECTQCFNDGGAWTAFNCVGKGGDPGSFVAWLLQLGTGLGGGIAFLLILVSGFQRITSAGNPEKLHEAKELMTAAISGLLLIIFSIFLLRIIGVDILQLPGWSG